MRTDVIETQWLDLCSQRSAAKKYFHQEHPLELLYGSNDRGQPVMALITAERLSVDDLSRDVATTSARRDDGRWATSWTLTDASLFPTFVRLCVMVAERSASPTSPRTALQEFVVALAQWQVLLRPSQRGRLSLERLRGLVGELWAGEAIVLRDGSRADLVQAWSGPLGGAQDFMFSSGACWEVKAKRSQARTIKISSAEQLDPLGKVLRLVVLDLDERDRDAPLSRSLVDLVRSWREALDDAPAQRNMFDVLLSHLGVDLSDPYYEETCFTVENATIFRVDGDFPSLRVSEIPTEVVAVRYELNVQVLAAWVVTETGEDI